MDADVILDAIGHWKAPMGSELNDNVSLNFRTILTDSNGWFQLQTKFWSRQEQQIPSPQVKEQVKISKTAKFDREML
jgi:hypothetical protein